MGYQNSLVDTTVSVADQMIDDLYSNLTFLDSGRLFNPSSLEKKRLLDKRTLNERVRAEGLSFLTISIPRLGKELDRFLSTLEPWEPVQGFRPVRTGTVPRFLEPVWTFTEHFARVLTGHEVDREVGGIEAASFAQWLALVRSFCYLFYKLEIDFTEEQRAEKLRVFMDIELEMDEVNASYPHTLLGTWVCDGAEAVLQEVLDQEVFPFASIQSSLSTDPAQ